MISGVFSSPATEDRPANRHCPLAGGEPRKGVKLMNASVTNLPSDTVLSVLANECAQAWDRAYELEDNRREGEWARYFAAVAKAEEIDEALALVPAESPIGVRIKHVVAMSRLPERGGRPAARESADRAGLVASLERDKAAMTLTYLPKIAYA
jgi:hypothetical protein